MEHNKVLVVSTRYLSVWRFLQNDLICLVVGVELTRSQNVLEWYASAIDCIGPQTGKGSFAKMLVEVVKKDFHDKLVLHEFSLIFDIEIPSKL